MKNVDLVKHRDGLRSAMGRTKDLGGEPELLGHWARYLCVLTAGYAENILRVLYSAYVERKASPEVAAFVVRQLERVQNPKAGKFVELAGAFESRWATDLKAFFEDDAGRRKNALDSIMNNRHLIAHGRSSSISVARVKEYSDAISEVADFIELQCES